MRVPLIAANWKMNKIISEARSFVEEMKSKVKDVEDKEIVICPPYTSLIAVKQAISNSNIELGAQNVFWEEKGAYTGEISVKMLKDIGCKYIILGHSERRKYFFETDGIINKKIKKVLEESVSPIFCIGETLEERERNITFDVLKRQLTIGLNEIDINNVDKVVIAYEPVWAIGTGRTATPSQAEEAHYFIRNWVKEKFSEENSKRIRIIYGGSIKPENISDLMKCENIDGGLVGGASLKIDSFVNIINY